MLSDQGLACCSASGPCSECAAQRGCEVVVNGYDQSIFHRLSIKACTTAGYVMGGVVCRCLSLLLFLLFGRSRLLLLCCGLWPYPRATVGAVGC